jgi:glycosyltransferase involved in cell wall biosynthesis
MKKLAFLIDYFDRRTAIGRVLCSFCRELKTVYNIETVILTVYAAAESINDLPEGLVVVPVSVTNSTIHIGQLVYMDYFFNSIGRKLLYLLETTPADCYLHISSSGHSISSAKRTAPLGYYCHGLIFTGFFSMPWYQSLSIPPILKALLRLTAPAILSMEAYRLQQFDFLLANSQFTKEQLYFHSGCKSQRVYLPLDVDNYAPRRNEIKDNYLFAVGNPREIEVDTVAELAQKTRVVYAGRRSLPHCDNRGFVSDQELGRLYSGAVATIFPHHHEEFGLIPLESMACGTPVLTYDYQGPGETVLNGLTGWTLDTRAQLVAKGQEVFEKGVTADMRRYCRNYVVDNFSPRVCTGQLLEAINLAIK